MSKAKKTQEVLGIRLSHGGKVIKDFDLKNAFTIGGIRTTSEVIALESSDSSYDLIRGTGTSSSLLFDDTVQGTITGEGFTLDIHSLKALGLLSKSGDKYVLPIKKGQTCSFSMDGMQFDLQYRVPARIAPVSVPKIREEKSQTEGFLGMAQEELNYYKSLGLAILFGVAFFVLTQLVEPPEREFAMEDLVKRVTKLEVPESVDEVFEEGIGEEVTEETAGGGGGGGGGGGESGPSMPSTGVVAAITAIGGGGGNIADILGAAGGGTGMGDLDSIASGLGGLSAGGGGIGGLGSGGLGGGTGLGGDGTGMGLLAGGGPGGGSSGKMTKKKVSMGSSSVSSVTGIAAGEASRSSGAINGKIRSHLAGIQNLYNSELKKNPNMGGGKVVVRFTIGANGSVKSVSIVSNSTGSSTLGSGIQSRVRGWKFPPASGDVTIVYPFVFITS